MIWVIRFVQGFSILVILLWTFLWGVSMLLILGIDQTVIEDITFSRFKVSGYEDSRAQLVLFITLVTIACAIKIYTYFRLIQLFNEFAAKRFFSLKAVNHLRVFAGLYTLGAFLGLVLNNLGRSKLSLNYDDIHSFVFGLIFLIIAHILVEARKAREELDSYF